VLFLHLITLNDTHIHIFGMTPLEKGSARLRDLNNIQHSQETDIHAPKGIRTRNPSKRAAADPCLRLRGHRDRCFGCFPKKSLTD
jgi:hypothetical protein